MEQMEYYEKHVQDTKISKSGYLPNLTRRVNIDCSMLENF